MNLRLFVCTLIAAVVMSGCKKYELDKEATQTFATDYNEPLTVNIYQSRDDYANNRNAWKQLTVQAGQPQAVSMEIGRQYWIDWYNADYTLTNWISQSGAIASQVVLSPGEISRTYDLRSPVSPGEHYGRRCLLPGNATSSVWRVAGQYNGAGSPLIATPFIQFTYYKDYRVAVEYDKPTGGREQVSGFFVLSTSGSFTPYVNTTIYSAGQNYLATCQYSDFSGSFPTSEDTFTCDFYAYTTSAPLYSCVLVRQ